MLYTLRFSPSSKCGLFHNYNIFGPCIIHILYTGCAKIKKIIPAPKGYGWHFLQTLSKTVPSRIPLLNLRVFRPSAVGWLGLSLDKYKKTCFLTEKKSKHVHQQLETNISMSLHRQLLANQLYGRESYLGVDGWIILGWISRRWDVDIWTGLGWPRIETVGGRLWVR